MFTPGSHLSAHHHNMGAAISHNQGISASVSPNHGNGVAASTASVCENLCSSLQFSDQNVTVNSCGYYAGGSTITIEGGQSVCGSTASPQVDLCRVALSVATSNNSENYMEAWLPTTWNGRFLATDNKGLAGCMSAYHISELRFDY